MMQFTIKVASTVFCFLPVQTSDVNCVIGGTAVQSPFFIQWFLFTSSVVSSRGVTVDFCICLYYVNVPHNWKSAQ